MASTRSGDLGGPAVNIITVRPSSLLPFPPSPCLCSRPSAGLPGGLGIARSLLPRVWIGVHDEEKRLSGVVMNNIWKRKIGIQEGVRSLGETVGEDNPRLGVMTDVVMLGSGEELKLGYESACNSDQHLNT